jgi:peptidoglycan/LPS O-acetylase OafA/YrhL
VDEILAGATLALIWLGSLGRLGYGSAWLLRTIPPSLWAIAFVVSCHPAGGPVQYLRPYLAASLVGSTLLVEHKRNGLLTSQPMWYIAEISYALYVIHPATIYGWLGSGDTLVRYLKRPLCLALTFGLAHLSTFAYERPWIALGKRLIRRCDRHPAQPGP